MKRHYYSVCVVCHSETSAAKSPLSSTSSSSVERSIAPSHKVCFFHKLPFTN